MICTRDKRFSQMAIICELPTHFSETSLITKESFISPSTSLLAGSVTEEIQTSNEGDLLPQACLIFKHLSLLLEEQQQIRDYLFPITIETHLICLQLLYSPGLSPIYIYEKGKALQVPQFYIIHNSNLTMLTIYL